MLGPVGVLEFAVAQLDLQGPEKVWNGSIARVRSGSELGRVTGDEMVYRGGCA